MCDAGEIPLADGGAAEERSQGFFLRVASWRLREHPVWEQEVIGLVTALLCFRGVPALAVGDDALGDRELAPSAGGIVSSCDSWNLILTFD